MREIGGYIELEHNRGEMLHGDGILLNCGRSCLAYIIKARGVKKIALPLFMCETVSELCHRYDVAVRYYHVGLDFKPVDAELADDEWLYLMDYYGQLDDGYICDIVNKVKRVIVDFAQNYFHEPVEGADTLYTCRKFFGVPDGGILYSNAKLDEEWEIDESYERMHFLLGRMERPASEFHHEYVENNEIFITEPIKQMSVLTQNLLRGIDYEYVKKRRTDNFITLHRRLEKLNQLDLKPVEGAFAYPLLVRNGAELRKELIKEKIYVPTLWPNVTELSDDMLEKRMALNILPLPCDQRYSEEDMEFIADQIEVE